MMANQQAALHDLLTGIRDALDVPDGAHPVDDCVLRRTRALLVRQVIKTLTDGPLDHCAVRSVAQTLRTAVDSCPVTYEVAEGTVTLARREGALS